MTDKQKTTLNAPTTSTVTTTRGKIINRNVNRIALIIINQGTAQIRIGSDETLTSSRGIPIPSGGVRNFLAIEDEAFLKGEIWAIAEAGSNTVEMFESVTP